MEAKVPHMDNVEYALVEDISEYFHTHLTTGLSSIESRRRLELYGYNELPKSKSIPIWKRFVDSLKNPLMALLFVCSVISFALQQHAEGVAILIIIMINAILTTYTGKGKKRKEGWDTVYMYLIMLVVFFREILC